MPCINSIRTQQIRPLLSEKSENYQLVRVLTHLSFLLSNEILFLFFLVPVLPLSTQKRKRDKEENKATKQSIMNVYFSFEILETTMKSYFCCNIELIAYFLFQARTFASLVLRSVNCINSRTCPNSRSSCETNTCSDELLTLSFHKKFYLTEITPLTVNCQQYDL